MTPSYVKHEKIWLKDHPQFREPWLRDRIVEDPAMLGLGKFDVKHAERAQPLWKLFSVVSLKFRW